MKYNTLLFLLWAITNIATAQNGEYFVKKFKQFPFRTNSIDVNKTNDKMVIGGENKTVVLYNLIDEKPIAEFEAHFQPVIKVKFSNIYDGFYSVGDRSVKLWTNDYEKPEKVYTGPNTSITDWAFSKNEEYFVAGSYDKKLRYWKATQLTEPFTSDNIHEKSIVSVAISPNSKLIATASLDNTIKIWGRDSMKLFRTFQAHTKTISCLKFVNNGQHLLSAANDGYIKLWDIKAGKNKFVFKGHTKAISSIAVSPNGKYMLTGSYDNTINLYNIADGHHIYTFEGHAAPVTNIVWAPSGDYFYSCDKEGNIFQWSTPTKLFVEFYYTDKMNEEMANSSLFKPKRKSESNKEYKERQERADKSYQKMLDKYAIEYNEFIKNQPFPISN